LRALLLVSPDIVELGARIEYPKIEASEDDEGAVAVTVCEVYLTP
jgi:hypothetical protein